jgi:hypothetical protein
VRFIICQEFLNLVVGFYYTKGIVNFADHSVTDHLELQDLKDCLMIEQEEKNELNKKLQGLEKECKCLIFLCLIHLNGSE